MSRNILIASISLVMLIGLTSTSSAQRTPREPRIGGVLPPPTQANFNPDVVTIWHKLGIPQGVGRFKKLRDSRINRDGLSPGKERKPPVLSIADPKNLEEGAPEMLKAAAQIKMDQDLAPQKIKALRYICSIGCSCYNKQTAGLIEKVLVEAMQDCTVDVRLAAMQVVLANAGNKCACSGQGQCETCCSEGVVKKLQEIAYKMNDKGCYIEPNQQVRNLAERALSACPPLVEPVEEQDPVDEPKKDPDLTDKGETGEEGGEGDLKDQGEAGEGEAGEGEAGEGETGEGEAGESEDGATETKDGDTEPGDAKPGEEDGPSLDDPKSDDDVDTIDGYFGNGRSPRKGSISLRNVSSRKSYGTAWKDPALHELQLRGVVDTIRKGSTEITIKFVQSYELPTGAQVVIALDENHASFGTVISSKTGIALINVEDYRVVENLKVSKRVRMGVLEK